MYKRQTLVYEYATHDRVMIFHADMYLCPNADAEIDKLLKKYNQQIDIVLKLSVSLETIKKRITERKSQEQRTDDSDEIAIKRFKTYELSSEPVLDYYKQSNLLKVINGENTISEINVEISGLIDAIKGWL